MKKTCITMPEELKQRVMELAEADDRSFSQFIRIALKNELERVQNGKPNTA
jgi:predicted transcriptional regulator